MKYYSKIAFKTIEKSLFILFEDILLKTNSYSGSLFVFDNNQKLIFKSLKNINIPIDSLNIGEIDEWAIKNGEIVHISDLKKIPELKYYSKNKIKDAIVFPIFFDGKLLSIINLNKKDSVYSNSEIELLKSYKNLLISTILNIFYIEELSSQKIFFETQHKIINLILEIFEKTKTQKNFLEELKNMFRKEYHINIYLKKTDKKHNYTIEIDNEYYLVNAEYINEIDILDFFEEKRKIDVNKFRNLYVFVEKLLKLKKLEEIDKKVEYMLKESREGLMLKFTSWKIFQEINSALSGIYLTIYTMDDNCKNKISDIVPSLDRIKNSIEDYKREFIKTGISKISLSNLIEDIITKLNILNFNIKKIVEEDIELYLDKDNFENMLMTLIIDILKTLHSKNYVEKIIIKIYKKDKRNGVVEMFLKDIIIQEKDIDMKIIKQTLDNLHIKVKIENTENTVVKILIPIK
ncbi:hypothetical protein JCM30566_14330 [Marinitoga arctica]